MTALLERQRASFLADGLPDLALRRNRIDRLLALVLDHADEFVEAMSADYGTRPRDGSLFTEILGMISVIEHTRTHVKKWMRPTTVLPSGRLLAVKGEVQPTPKGVVGIIGPWNFPLNLVVLPASAAFAAGNRVMIKMSDVTPRTAALMAALAPEYFDPAELAIVTGDVDVAAAFSALPFDHLFFTGSPSVGALVAQAAAENLVPVTLELGGKNPVVVGPAADIGRAASRIAQGRMINGGQVCVCPDYVFVPAEHLEKFCAVVRDTWRAMFGSIVDNPDYCSVVNRANFDRVTGLIEDARDKGACVEAVIPPREHLPDPATRKIAPTLVRGVDETMRLATEETFGPVLTVRPYRNLREVVDYVNARPSPLVAYWFGPDDEDFRGFVRRTRTGGVARNDFGAQMIPSAAPFGGVGRSGMGAYHGKAGFDAFTHHRSVVGSDLPFTVTGRAAPPFSRATRWMTALALRSARNRTRRRLT
ncbi:coniferyl aldehyde dehydrogenase [Mycolicibacterium duvalii]|nr:coniferyl aldehyde dehydrogenase [Mycolicibacterium duvalii]MCV7370468.1 coniferyl aldehyde dehydrogenase [Mycolicibacterium duvalii]PEG37438.1 coniferyl aldehyde dehydrogenase [Mycolicibacterium duvalii]